jgi:hypothetical protein
MMHAETRVGGRLREAESPMTIKKGYSTGVTA